MMKEEFYFMWLLFSNAPIFMLIMSSIENKYNIYQSVASSMERAFLS